MAIQIFLGQPPARIKQWMIDHPPTPAEEPDPIDTTSWGQLVAALEGCSASDFNMTNLSYTGSNPTLTALAVGAGATVKYDIASNGTAVDTTWINLGFNGCIPEYVKYRRAVGSGWKHVWVKSMKSGLIAPIAVNDAVYTRAFDSATDNNIYTAVDSEVITAIDGTFTYGNNCTYSVPTSITTAKGTYTFCGYNLMLNSQALLLDKNSGIPAAATCTTPYFDNQNYSNRYGSAPIRAILNNKTGTCPCYYYDFDWNVEGDGTCNSIVGKVESDVGLLQNIAHTVNRTWVHDSWRSGVTLDANNCEHVVDKLFLLGGGHVSNGGDDYLNAQDKAYDTAKILSFNSNASRIKCWMNADGSVGGSARYWWLRSADSGNDDFVGYVNYDGEVDYYSASDNYGCSPAFQIG